VPSVADPSSGFGEEGSALSRDGEVAMVGAPYQPCGSTVLCGFVSAFRRGAGAWQESQILAPPDVDSGLFGGAIALSADGATAVIGARYHSCANLSPQCGRAYVFTNNGSGWAWTATLVPSHEEPGADFGFSVALSADGSTALVGAPDESDPPWGWVYVFAKSGSSWEEAQRLPAASASLPLTTFFGSSVALSGDGLHALVGYSTSHAIHVDSFSLQNGTWTVDGLLAKDELEEYGEGMALALTDDGSSALVGNSCGSCFPDGSFASNGFVASFVRSGNTWSSPQTMQEPGPPQLLGSHYFGGSCALAGSAIGAVAALDTAYTFELVGGMWTPTQTIHLPPQTAGVVEAPRVSLSADGNTLLVSAPAGLAGAAYIYSRALPVAQVPTISAAGTVALCLTLAACGSWTLRRRSQRRKPRPTASASPGPP
jgi:hypothetical protein